VSELDLSSIDLTTEVIRTDRLVLRPFRDDDVAAVFAGCQDPDVQRWS
jgi:RimJ/RimL family protein N-acetyltransferase